MLSDVLSLLVFTIFAEAWSTIIDGTVQLSCQRKHFELLYEPYQTIGLDFVRISRAYLQSSHHSSRSLPTDHSNHNNNGNGDSNNGNNDNRNTNQNNNRQICRSEFRRQSMTQLVLKANYQRCSGIVSLDLEDGTLHTITIDYYTSANHVNRSFTITCFVPNKELDLASIPFRMSLWNGNKQIQNVQQATLRIGDQLNARLEANAHFSYPVALNAYPVACHTAQPGGKARAEVVREGCPSMNDPAGRSLRLVQNISNLGSIQMRFTINERLMPWTKSTDQNELGEFLIECTSLPCTGDRFAGISGVPQCPRTTLFCFGATEDENAQFPKALRNFPTVSVTSPFPINVTRYKISEEEKAITTMCEQRCNLGIEEDIQEPQYTLISLRTTIILAIVSLLIGVCFAAGIWFIHIRTQGKTKRHLRREELSRIPIVAEADAHAA